MTILSVFMIVALTAVGFAAWLIVGTIEADTQGSFVSNELKDKYFKVEVEFEGEGNGDIIFGRPATAYKNENDAWLSYSNKDEVEQLAAMATVKFIPDDGFFKNDTKPEENRDMKYYLEEVIEKDDGSIDKTQHRTVRVVIDIFDVIGTGATDNYKWFDMAVQLGYIQYPTAYVMQREDDGSIPGGQTYETAEYKLEWCTNDSATSAETKLVALEDNEENKYKKFQNGVLAIDLDYSQFYVDYDDDGTAEEATALIWIQFEWGEAVSEITTPDNPVTTGIDETVITYYNPYTFFNKEAHKPENTLDIDFYLDSTNAIKETVVNTVDDPDTEDIVETDTNPADNKTIRYKDLAQRMLDYLRDYLNYTAPVYEDDGTTIKTPAKGIQFSITLIEGTPVVE